MILHDGDLMKKIGIISLLTPLACASLEPTQERIAELESTTLRWEISEFICPDDETANDPYTLGPVEDHIAIFLASKLDDGSYGSPWSSEHIKVSEDMIKFYSCGSSTNVEFRSSIGYLR